MSNRGETATIGRICDALPKGWHEIKGDWRKWPQTFRALTECYYVDRFPSADQAYSLEGLSQFQRSWQIEHGHREIAHEHLDQATAHEVRFHANRGRLFRRPCAALSTCWRAIISERPERVLDRAARAAARPQEKATASKSSEIPYSNVTLGTRGKAVKKVAPSICAEEM